METEVNTTTPKKRITPKQEIMHAIGKSKRLRADSNTRISHTNLYKDGKMQQTIFHTPYKEKGKTKVRSLTVHERISIIPENL